MIKVNRKIGDQQCGMGVAINGIDIEDMSFRQVKNALIDLTSQLNSLSSKADEGDQALNLIETIKANVVNRKLTDSQFRQFMVNTLLTSEDLEVTESDQGFTPKMQDSMEEELCQIAGSLQLNGVDEEYILDLVREKFQENNSQLQEG